MEIFRIEIFFVVIWKKRKSIFVGESNNPRVLQGNKQFEGLLTQES